MSERKYLLTFSAIICVEPTQFIYKYLHNIVTDMFDGPLESFCAKSLNKIFNKSKKYDITKENWLRDSICQMNQEIKENIQPIVKQIFSKQCVVEFTGSIIKFL